MNHKKEKMRNRKKKNLWKSNQGAAGVEAAILIPVLVFLIIGFIEVYQYYRAAALMDRTAFNLASGISIQRDLYDKNQCTKSDDICTYNAIAKDLMQPLDFEKNGHATFSVYAATEPNKNSVVQWEKTPKWQKKYRGSNQSINRPEAGTNLDTAQFPPANQGDTVIAVELFYDYEPFAISSVFWNALGGEKRLYSRAFFRPRFSDVRELIR